MSDQTLGIIIIVVLGALWMAVGLWVARRMRSADDYVVAGRNVGISLGAATILATWVTGNTVLAAPESGYNWGVLGVIGYALTGGLGVLAFAPLARRIRAAMPHGRTVGDFFRLRYDAKNYYLFLIMLIIWDFGWLLTQGMGAGILLEAVFGIDFHTGLILTIAIVTIYVTVGGMVSVLGTDFMQTMLIMVVVFVFPAWIFIEAGPTTVFEGMQGGATDQLNLLLPIGVLWLVAGPLIGIGEVFMDNTFWQRAFCLRPGQTFRTFTFAGLGWMFVPLATGTLAWVALGTGVTPDPVNEVAPLVVEQYAGRFGSVLFLALVWAAIASTVAALLNAVAAIFMNDVFNNFVNRGASDRTLLIAGRAFTIFAAVVTIIIAWPKPLTMLTLLILLGVINAAYILPVTLGLFWSKTNRHGAFVGALVGSVVGLFFFGNGGFELLWTKIEITELPAGWGGPFQGVIVGFLISALFTIGATLLQPDRFNFRRIYEHHIGEVGRREEAEKEPQYA
jgi:urea-proton symporter